MWHVRRVQKWDIEESRNTTRLNLVLYGSRTNYTAMICGLRVMRGGCAGAESLERTARHVTATPVALTRASCSLSPHSEFLAFPIE